MAGTPIPPALKALRASLRQAVDENLRDRLSTAIRYLERLYGVRSSLPPETGDMRRRKVFAKFPHHFDAHSKSRTAPEYFNG